MSPGRWCSYLAKVHRLHTFTTKSRTDRRTRAGLPSSNDELDELVDSRATPGFGHCVSVLSIVRGHASQLDRLFKGGGGGRRSTLALASIFDGALKPSLCVSVYKMLDRASELLGANRLTISNRSQRRQIFSVKGRWELKLPIACPASNEEHR